MDHATGASPVEAAQAFLYGRIDYERTSQLPPRMAGVQLERMRELLRRLGDPHLKLQIAHLAGTKGKGSTAAFVAGILLAAGQRVGLYSSPHLERLEERLCIDGHPCSAQQLVELVNDVRPAVEAMDASEEPTFVGATFFEITTALGMLYFQRQAVDYAVFEVGMGGRLDSTNVCEPLVSVITSISFDHTKQLGNTLGEIAREKSGIIKEGVDVVSGVREEEPRTVVRQRAVAQGSRLYELSRDFDYDYRLATDDEEGSAESPPHWAMMNYRDENLTVENIPLQMMGRHQADNAALAIAAVKRLAAARDATWEVSSSIIRQGIGSVVVPARIEIVRRRPLVILDTAHNVASIQALINALSSTAVEGKRIVVFAATRDKDVRGMLRLLLPHFDECIVTKYSENVRCASPRRLARIAAELQAADPQMRCATRVVEDPLEAWEVAREVLRAEDLVCITGSFFLAAELRKYV